MNVSLDEIGQRWGALLSQSMAQTIILEKQVKALTEQNEALKAQLQAALNELQNNKPTSSLSAAAREIADREIVRK